eukprot:Gregarina_sp_Poly_1__10171@NODE_69_length_16257_cov_66_887276_g59_i0_p14_GENE_NODE_69_length_16257_cov_66_887276_g59_i0NODE_69_length_16257_cov_66_887276_g59_i0_p14_ORF_typecomplete_len111_score6_52RCC1_2/PF13540_6/1e02RCC1_2/PF13540_6/4e02RCC1_2/PF13540_6/0_059PK_C/PF02887_16/3_2PK_C/PF02887_16/1_3e02_NODE_69_length_16257_cov_66_887276_g59_i01134511677
MAVKQEALIAEKVFAVTVSAAAIMVITESGRAIPWGDTRMGGTATGIRVHDLRTGDNSFGSTARAFAAMRKDGSVIAWGDPAYGGSTDNVIEWTSNRVLELWVSRRSLDL